VLAADITSGAVLVDESDKKWPHSQKKTVDFNLLSIFEQRNDILLPF